MKCFLCQVISAAWLSSLKYSCNNTGSRSKNWRTTSRHRAAAPTSLLRVDSKSVVMHEYLNYTRNFLHDLCTLLINLCFLFLFISGFTCCQCFQIWLWPCKSCIRRLLLRLPSFSLSTRMSRSVFCLQFLSVQCCTKSFFITVLWCLSLDRIVCS